MIAVAVLAIGLAAFGEALSNMINTGEQIELETRAASVCNELVQEFSQWSISAMESQWSIPSYPAESINITEVDVVDTLPDGSQVVRGTAAVRLSKMNSEPTTRLVRIRVFYPTNENTPTCEYTTFVMN